MLEVELTLSDHVGNQQQTYWYYHLDHKSPQVTYTSDQICSWSASEHLDIQSTCNLHVDINDDTNPALLSLFEIQISVIGSNEIDRYSINQNRVINLANYSDSTVTISVVGSDLTNKPILENYLRVQIRDTLTPRWDGLICAGNLGCGWDGALISSFSSSNIGVSTYTNQAPIIESSFIFESPVNSFLYNSTSFDANSLADGEYVLAVIFKDAAGRVFEPEKISFIYDNTAPIIEILETQSVGTINLDLSQPSFLSCDECLITWRVLDSTSTIVTTNHGNFPSNNGQFQMSTSGFGSNLISILATDELGRNSVLNITTTPVNSTLINPLEEIRLQDNTALICLESETVEFIRQVNCLWSRNGSASEDLPIYVDIYVDQIELRNVDITVDKGSGSSLNPVTVSNSGTLFIPGIAHYDTEFTLNIRDKFSIVTPIKYNLIRHIKPWSDPELIDGSVSEMNSQDVFDIIIPPASNEGEFMMLTSGFYDASELIDCNGEYEFAKKGSVINYAIENSNCNIQEWYILPNESLYLNLKINHIGIREELVQVGILNAHSQPLFNIAKFSVKLQYSDSLGVSLSSEMDIPFDNIIRSPDSLPHLVITSECPLERDWDTFDGYLQSDNTAPFSNCVDNIFDEDGVHAIEWLFYFENKNNQNSVDPIIVTCLGDYIFPKNWAIEDAKMNGECEYSRLPPSGIFDVEIKIKVKDNKMFFNDNELHESVVLCKQESQSRCEEYVTFKRTGVRVFGTWESTESVENTRELIEIAESVNDAVLLLIIFTVPSTVLYLVWYVRHIKGKTSILLALKGVINKFKVIR